MYVLVALGVMEGADLIFPALSLPETAYRLVVVFLLLGFPIAVVFAWAFELGPEGVHRERPADEAARDAVSGAGGPAPRASPSRVRPGWAVVLIAAILLLVWRPWREGGGDSLAALAGSGFLDSVAILPVENRTGDSSLIHVAAGLTEEMVGRLKRLGRVKVIDPYSVERFVELRLTPPQIADSLGVEKLVFSALYREGDRLRLRVRATEAESGDVLWTERYEASERETFAAAARLAEAFGQDYLEHAPRLTASVTMSHPGHETTSQRAYLLGKTWLGRRTAEGLSEAREKFEEAIALDPSNAEAHAGLSKAHALSLAYRYRWPLDGYETAGRALELATRAIEMEPELAAGYSARGYIATRSHAPADEVLPDCQEAIELAPGAADGLSWCARVLNQQGQVDAAFRAAEQAIAIDPQNAGRRLALAYEALSLGRAGRALSEARAARGLQPELMLPRVIEARALLLSGRAGECARMNLGPHDGIRAACLYELGRRAEAVALADSIARELSEGGVADSVYSDVVRAEDLATYYAWVGDVELALTWIDYAFALSPSGVEARVLDSALFAKVRADPAGRVEVERLRGQVWDRVEAASRTGASTPSGDP